MHYKFLQIFSSADPVHLGFREVNFSVISWSQKYIFYDSIQQLKINRFLGGEIFICNMSNHLIYIAVRQYYINTWPSIFYICSVFRYTRVGGPLSCAPYHVHRWTNGFFLVRLSLLLTRFPLAFLSAVCERFITISSFWLIVGLKTFIQQEMISIFDDLRLFVKKGFVLSFSLSSP